jgi:hypothetical protein
MSSIRRATYGALSGVGGTLVLTGLRKIMAASGLVGITAPEQVIEKLEELGLLEDWSPEARRLLTGMAHLAYGVGIGTSLGLLRRERGEAGACLNVPFFRVWVRSNRKHKREKESL